MPKTFIRMLSTITSLLLLFSANAQNTFWVGTTGSENTNVLAFAVSANQDIFAATNGGVLRSSDNGWRWISSGFTSSCKSIAVDSTGRIFVGDKFGVALSANNGLTWNRVLTTTERFPDGTLVYHSVTSIAILGPNVVAVGTNAGGIFRSLDHGQTWASASSGLTNKDVRSLNFSASGIAYAGTKAGVFRSFDKGLTWEHRPAVQDWTYAVVSSNGNEVFAGVSYTVGGSGVYHSTNAGDNWTTFGLQQLPIVGLAIDAHRNLLACVNISWNPAEYGVYRTTLESGQWVHQVDGMKSIYCSAIAILLDGSAIAGTDVGIFRTRAPLTSIRGQSDVPTSLELFQNSPNPFNPTTTIRFDLPKSENVTLKVFDILGREVATLVNEHVSAGTFRSEWDAANMSSGTYFYRLQAGDFVATKKLLLLK